MDTALTHRLIDGRAFAAKVLQGVRAAVDQLQNAGHPVGIATLLVGDDYAASVYQRRIDRHARDAGIASRPVQMPADATFGEVGETSASNRSKARSKSCLISVRIFCAFR